MIKEKGIVNVQDGEVEQSELQDSLFNLPDGEYGYLLFDKKKNKALPQLKYLFGVVLKEISDQLPDHPPVEALYRYFEEIYAPIRSCTINGEKYEYFDIKNEKNIEMNGFIEKIIHHATTEWGIQVISRDDLKSGEASEAYAGAYAEMWENLSRKI